MISASQSPEARASVRTAQVSAGATAGATAGHEDESKAQAGRGRLRTNSHNERDTGTGYGEQQSPSSKRRASDEPKRAKSTRVASSGGIKRKMTTREELLLTPFEKATRFSRFPGKAVLDIVLTLLITTQIVLSNVQSAASYRAAHRNWLFLFFPADYDFSTPEAYVYTPNATIDAVQRGVWNYYHVNNVSLDTFLYDDGSDSGTSSTPSPVPLHVVQYANGGPSFAGGHASFDDTEVSSVQMLTPWDLGPMDPNAHSPADLARFFGSLRTMTAHYGLQSYQLGPLYRNCLRWNISVLYDFSSRGELSVTLDDQVVGDCGGADLWYINGLAGLVLVLCVLHQLLLLRSMYRQVQLVLQLKRWASRRRPAKRRSMRVSTGKRPAAADDMRAPLLSTDRRQPSHSTGPNVVVAAVGTPTAAGTNSSPAASASVSKVYGEYAYRSTDSLVVIPTVTWDSLTCRDKLRFVHGWFILGSVANVAGVIAAAFNVAGATTTNPTQLGRNLALGLAAGTRCIGLLRYLAHNRAYYTLVLTLQRAMPRVLRFLLGVLPVFFAYSLFAVIVFGDTVERFGTLWVSMVTLFAVLNGDVVRDTFEALDAEHAVVGQIFMYSFVSLFIFACLNICIALVEEAFFFTTERSAALEEQKRELQAVHETLHGDLQAHVDDTAAHGGEDGGGGSRGSRGSGGGAGGAGSAAGTGAGASATSRSNVVVLPATDNAAIEFGLALRAESVDGTSDVRHGGADASGHQGTRGDGVPVASGVRRAVSGKAQVARLLGAMDLHDHLVRAHGVDVDVDV